MCSVKERIRIWTLQRDLIKWFSKCWQIIMKSFGQCKNSGNIFSQNIWLNFHKWFMKMPSSSSCFLHFFFYISIFFTTIYIFLISKDLTYEPTYKGGKHVVLTKLSYYHSNAPLKPNKYKKFVATQSVESQVDRRTSLQTETVSDRIEIRYIQGKWKQRNAITCGI